MGERGRRCVFTSAGDFSNVASWTSREGPRDWDLITAFYGADDAAFEMLRDLSDTIVRSRGGKFQNLKTLRTGQPALFAGYDWVLVSDDDIIWRDPADIDRLFDIAEAFDFWLCQPAFDPAGRISHDVTRVHAGTRFRYVNYVENTCPLMRADKLWEFIDIYDGGLVGWGIDWWYCETLRTRRFSRAAVVDEITVINPRDHQRSGGQREIRKLMGDAEREAQWMALSRKLEVPQFEPSTVASVTRHAPGASNAHRSSLAPRLSACELGLWASFLDRSLNYFEFGAGDTTVRAAEEPKRSVSAVDHLAVSLDGVARACGEAGLRTPTLLRARGDDGPGYHGVPTPAVGAADFVLIDGPFRVACFLRVGLECSPTTLIAVHDYASRLEYGVIGEIADEIARAETLSVFRAPNTSRREAVRRLLPAHAHDDR